MQSGFHWGPFTARLPFIHLRPEWPELVQGLVVASATGLAIVPLYAEHFGMGFETAVALVVVQTIFITSAFMVFGDPFCPGWLTPALPLVLREAIAIESTPDRIDFVNAVVLTVGIVFLLFGVTGLGARFLRMVPRVVKAGIILGAGMSAVYGEFLPRTGGRPSRIDAYTVSILAATALTMLLLFSEPVERWKKTRPWLRILAGLGIAPGFLLAMFIGPWVGEVSYQTFHDYNGPFWFWPDFDGLVSNFSILGLGLPEPEMFLRALPLALAAYVIGFGDIITGRALIEEAAADRPDDPILFSELRTHLQLGIRNAGIAIFGGPFFPLQGPLWTGATVVVSHRWRQGREGMQSLFSGITSYYFLGLPFFYFVRPAMEFFRPVLDVAFSLTLLLTGFACAYVALAMVHERVERGIVLLVGMTILGFSTATGLVVGFALTIGLIGVRAWKLPESPHV